MLPNPIKKFVDIFSQLPSIGPRQATRLAFYLFNLGPSEVGELAQSIADLQNLRRCPSCFFIHGGGGGLCHICGDERRRKDIVMVVEKETDLISLEKAGGFQGRYFVTGDLKKRGILESEQKMKLNSLKSSIKKEFGAPPEGGAEEIILAFNPTTYGDYNASLLSQELKDCAKKITRLGRGIPTGGEIEFADEETLGGALQNRR
ncbi:MAG: toprim domain-containing protein [Patescibacteria group bacterium]